MKSSRALLLAAVSVLCLGLPVDTPPDAIGLGAQFYRRA
jgi:hypothetical protein